MIITRLYYLIVGIALMAGIGDAFVHMTKAMGTQAAYAHQKGPISLKKLTSELTGEKQNK